MKIKRAGVTVWLWYHKVYTRSTPEVSARCPVTDEEISAAKKTFIRFGLYTPQL